MGRGIQQSGRGEGAAGACVRANSDERIGRGGLGVEPGINTGN
jgi:hypothetical protein